MMDGPYDVVMKMLLVTACCVQSVVTDDATTVESLTYNHFHCEYGYLMNIFYIQPSNVCVIVCK